MYSYTQIIYIYLYGKRHFKLFKYLQKKRKVKKRKEKREGKVNATFHLLSKSWRISFSICVASFVVHLGCLSRIALNVTGRSFPSWSPTDRIPTKIAPCLCVRCQQLGVAGAGEAGGALPGCGQFSTANSTFSSFTKSASQSISGLGPLSPCSSSSSAVPSVSVGQSDCRPDRAIYTTWHLLLLCIAYFCPSLCLIFQLKQNICQCRNLFRATIPQARTEEDFN